MNWLETPKRIEVVWEDHHVNATPEARPYHIQTIGYLVNETESVLQLSLSWDEDGSHWKDETVTIVKKCIVKRRTLK